MEVAKIFKALAKLRGPFVVGAQYGFRRGGGSYPYNDCQPVKDGDHPRRFFALFHLAYAEGIVSMYDFNDQLKRKLARHFGTRHYDNALGVMGAEVYGYQVNNIQADRVLVTSTAHILFPLEWSDDNENE